MKKNGAFRILCDNYVTDDSGTGVVHQAPFFGAVSFLLFILLCLNVKSSTEFICNFKNLFCLTICQCNSRDCIRIKNIHKINMRKTTQQSISKTFRAFNKFIYLGRLPSVSSKQDLPKGRCFDLSSRFQRKIY